MALADVAVRSAKTREKDYKLADGAGLCCLVTSSGGKLWGPKHRVHGVERKLALGRYPGVSLGEARKARDAAREQVSGGEDPSAKRRRGCVATRLAMGTAFGDGAQGYINKAQREGRAEAAVAKLRWMRGWLLRATGRRRADQVEPHELLAVMKRLENAGKLETAKRVRSLASRVLRYAVAAARARADPAGLLPGAIGPPIEEPRRDHGAPTRRRASLRDTAEALGLGRTSIHRLIAEGRPGASKLGRRRLVRVDSIHRLVDAQGRGSGADRIRDHHRGTAPGARVVPARARGPRGRPSRAGCAGGAHQGGKVVPHLLHAHGRARAGDRRGSGARARARPPSGRSAPLFAATEMALGAEGAFLAQGLSRRGWATSEPVREIFRRAFEAAELPRRNPRPFRDMPVRHAMSLDLAPEAMRASSQDLGHADVPTAFTSYGQVPTHRPGKSSRLGQVVPTGPAARGRMFKCPGPRWRDRGQGTDGAGVIGTNPASLLVGKSAGIGAIAGPVGGVATMGRPAEAVMAGRGTPPRTI